MALDSNIRGVSSGVGAEVDASNQLKVALGTDPTKAGFIRNAWLRDSTTAREMRVTEEGESFSASGRLLFYSDFNGATLLNNQWNTQATTMAVALAGGFVRLNSGSIVTTNTGVAINSARTFSLEDGIQLRIKAKIRHSNGAIANKQFEFGVGMYQVAANQAGASTEFIGFRWTQAGNLIGVIEYSTGGAPTALTTGTTINGGVPLSDNVSREYEIVISTSRVEFYIDGVYQSTIEEPADGPGLLKGASYPILNRLFITTATALAPVFDISDVTVLKIGAEADIPISYRQALMGRHSAYPQTGLTGTNGNTAVAVANATAPTATAGSNTAAASTGLGGYYALTATNIGTANNNTIINAFQNPAIPITAGAGTHGRNLIITGIRISPMVVTTALTGGGAVLNWFVAVGNTAVSYATTDAAGTTALGSKSPRIIPLSVVDSIAAAAAVGVVATRVGDSYYALETPLVVHPGEFISVGVRTIQATAAVTAGVISGGIGFGGYWD